MIRKSFFESYIPFEKLSIDEFLLLWKGHLSWKIYDLFKAAKYSIEFYVLAKSDTGYIVDRIIYHVKQTEYKILNTTLENLLTKLAQIVPLLLGDRYIGKGYILGLDNFYRTPEPNKVLLRSLTDFVGTLKTNRKDLPLEIKNAKLKKDKIVSMYKDKLYILKWQSIPTSTVTIMSSIYDDQVLKITKSGKEREKPKVFLDYKSHMCGVNLMDQILSSKNTVRLGLKKYYKEHLYTLSYYKGFEILYTIQKETYQKILK